MNIRIVILIYLVAFIAGAFFKTIQYLIQPESIENLNSAVLELTIVSTLVAAGVSLFYLLKLKRDKEDS